MSGEQILPRNTANPPHCYTAPVVKWAKAPVTGEHIIVIAAKRTFTSSIFVLAAALLAAPAYAEWSPNDPLPAFAAPLKMTDIANPANEGYAPATQRVANAPPAPAQRLRSWELPPVQVVGEQPSELREEDRVGSYGQPRWTADRRFTGTRTYVIPENKIEFEYWLKPEVPQHGGPTAFESLYEVEIGLPHRFQLDLYYIQDWLGNGNHHTTGQAIEMRYALANWGKIWGNPAFYIEYTFLEDQPDRVEGKLLLTDQLAPRWHWGLNLSFETAIAGIRDREYELTGGISYTLIDEKLSVGGEFEASLLDTKDRRGNFNNEVKIGPSIQWRPLPQIHIDFAPLVGVTDQSPAAKIYFIFGYEF